MDSTATDMHRLALARIPFALVITNPNLHDNPIVFVNSAFSKLTGYAAEAAVGRNCRFLQGADTDPAAVTRIREGLAGREDFAVELVNYKADGTPFLNRLHIAPLYDEDGHLTYFIGVQRAIGAQPSTFEMDSATDTALREIHHRVKNHLAMVVGMIRMQARERNATSMENYANLARRIETLQFLYDEMMTGQSRGSDALIPLGAYVSRIASAIAYLDGRESVQLSMDLAHIHVPVDVAAQIGLLVSELLTNAYKHAFGSTGEGSIELRLKTLSDGSIRIVVADDGAGLPKGTRWPENGGLGGRIVRSLLTGLDAKLDVTSSTHGASFIIDVSAERFVATDEASRRA